LPFPVRGQIAWLSPQPDVRCGDRAEANKAVATVAELFSRFRAPRAA
jgi:hypothetical protein